MLTKVPFVSWSHVAADDSSSLEKVSTRDRIYHLWTAWIEDGWLLECLSLALGCALLITLCLVLKFFDGHTVPELGSSLGAIITINTIVAIIGTCIQACLAYPVAECLSQLKWQWLLTDRKLEDVSVFDKATRGPTGSLMLLGTIRKLATLGAVLVVSAVAVTPFFQQLISIAPQPVPISGGLELAASPVLQQWNEHEQDDGVYVAGSNTGTGGAVINAVSIGMSGAVQTGLFLQKETLPHVSPLCSSGNCTFEPYRSLAVCSSFADLSGLLEYHTYSESRLTKSQFSLNSRFYLNSGDRWRNETEASTGHYLNVTSIPAYTSIAFPSQPAAPANVIVMVASRFDHCSAYEFRLEWCVQEYTTTVENGIASTEVVRTWRNLTSLEEEEAFAIETDQPGEQYRINMASNNDIYSYLNDMLNGSVQYNLIASSLSTRAIYQQLRANNVTGLELMVSNLAKSMTNYMRRPGSSSSQDHSMTLFTGTAWKETTIIVIRWHWITGPAIFAGLTVIFVLCTILSTRACAIGHIWKSSSLAMMHALDSSLQRDLGGLGAPSELRRQDENIMVRLTTTNSAGYWRIVSSDQFADQDR